MKKSIIILGLLFFTFIAKAQENEKHEFRVGYSDATFLIMGTGLSDAFGDAIVSGIYGAKIDNAEDSTLGMFEIGYRNRITERLKIGVDVSYLRTDKSFETKLPNSGGIEHNKRRAQYFLVLPTIEFSYVRTSFINFYGSAAAGIIMMQTKEIDNTNAYTDNATAFGFQVNPVGLRVGKKLGAFAELGYGYKGIIVAGISYKL